jgi:hypothetical protein
LPVLIIGLAVLAIQPRISASEQASANATPAAVAKAVKLQPSATSTPTPEAAQAKLDDTACGTY